LERAPRYAPAEALYAQLWTGQHAQALALGLASDGKALIARGYRHSQLSTRERVYVLNRLGRSDEALALALEGARSSDSAPEDRAALEADARNLGAGRARYVRATGELGVRVRNEQTARPFGTVALKGRELVAAAVQGAVLSM
jgi:hypothetical protein